MEQVSKIISTLLPHGPADSFAVGTIDFKNSKYEAIEANTFEGEVKFSKEPMLYFDLASLTKVLANSLSYFLKPESFDDKMLLALSHRGGLPAWGLLPHVGWKEIIMSYPIQESETLYSDYSALRVMLELEKKGIDQKKLCQSVWDKETMNWLDLPRYFSKPQYGFKYQRPNYGEVHDPNAWVIRDFTSHAGLFSTIDGLCRTLLSYQQKTDFIPIVKTNLREHRHRFAYGWDRVENVESTLAGAGCGQWTFGHLGFTGTSIWIDPDRMFGHIILSNTTKYHWYDKTHLNDMRRAIGECIWKRH